MQEVTVGDPEDLWIETKELIISFILRREHKSICPFRNRCFSISVLIISVVIPPKTTPPHKIFTVIEEKIILLLLIPSIGSRDHLIRGIPHRTLNLIQFPHHISLRKFTKTDLVDAYSAMFFRIVHHLAVAKV